MLVLTAEEYNEIWEMFMGEKMLVSTVEEYNEIWKMFMGKKTLVSTAEEYNTIWKTQRFSAEAPRMESLLIFSFTLYSIFCF